MKSLRTASRALSGVTETESKAEPDTPAVAAAAIQGLLPGCHDIAALEEIHLAVVQEIASLYGPGTAVQVLARALLELQFHEEDGDDEGLDDGEDGTDVVEDAVEDGAAGMGSGEPGPQPEVVETPFSREDVTPPFAVARTSLVPDLAAVKSKTDLGSGMKKKMSKRGSVHDRITWRKAMSVVLHDTFDVWSSRGIHRLRPRLVVRHRYRLRGDETDPWVTDEVLIKMEDKPFAAGAMRECYAVKKLSSFSNSLSLDWKRAANFVAKRYKKAVPDRIYFADVKLQMDAKQMGERYNQTNPPKKIDVMMVCVIEVPQEEPEEKKRLYCLENLIEGDYIKYNSNSGFVDEVARNTPQAFSHYTFIESKGQKLCVDIQGCNPLCQRLEMDPFQRCDADVRATSGLGGDSTSGSGLTVSKSFQRSQTLQVEMERALSESVMPVANIEPFDHTLSLRRLADVAPGEHVHARVHFEVAKLHGEVLALAELHTPAEQWDAALGSLFHLQMAAWLGNPLALCTVARVHWGLPPSSSILNAVVEKLREKGYLQEDAEVALRYAELAADRGVRNAAAAMAHALVGAPQELKWLEAASGPPGPPEAEEEAASFPGAESSMHERLAAQGTALMAAGKAQAAADAFNAAAELAMEACSGRLAQLYYEKAAEAEASVD
eukprot:jgi/Botrbrau1/1928/Bobra.0005s0031.1